MKCFECFGFIFYFFFKVWKVTVFNLKCSFISGLMILAAVVFINPILMPDLLLHLIGWNIVFVKCKVLWLQVVLKFMPGSLHEHCTFKQWRFVECFDSFVLYTLFVDYCIGFQWHLDFYFALFVLDFDFVTQKWQLDFSRLNCMYKMIFNVFNFCVCMFFTLSISWFYDYCVMLR